MASQLATSHSTAFGLPSPPLPQLAVRPADSHKGNFGHAFLIGGSRGMSGAIALSGMASLRTGAGLVSLAVPDRCLETVASVSPCLMTIPLKDDDSGKLLSGAFEQLEARLSKATCVAIGPGLGKSRELQTLIHKVIRGSRSPLVIDADGLNNLADSTWQPGKAKCPLVITPHPGEWARLSGVPTDDRIAQCESAIEFSQKNGVTIVLKGQHTLVTDGNTAVLNDTGTPAMSIGGSGDVLTGIITALICQGLAPRDAAHLGVYIHGLAGELAQQRLQSHVVLPTDLIDSIAEAIQKSRES